MKRPIDLTALGLMILLCLLWGWQQSAMKLAAPAVDPLMQIGLRSSFAAVLVVALSRFVMRDRWQSGIFWGPGLVAGILFALEFLFVGEGLKWTSASHMAVFLYTAPIFAAIGLHLAQPEERLKPIQWIGVVIAFCGVAVIFLMPEFRRTGAASPSSLFGDLLGLGAGLSWGLTTVVIRTTRLSDAPPAQTLSCQLVVAGVLALGVSVLTGPVAIHLAPMDVANLATQTILVCTVSFLVWFRMLQVYSSSRLGVLSLMTPVFGVLIGTWLLGERLTVELMVGGAMALSGMLIVQAQDVFARRKPNNPVAACLPTPSGQP